MQVFKNLGKIQEGVIRFLSQTNSILLFKPQITVHRMSSKSNQNCSRSSVYRETDRM